MAITDNAIERAMTGPMIDQIWTKDDEIAGDREGWVLQSIAYMGGSPDIFHGGWTIMPTLSGYTMDGEFIPARSREEIIFHIVDKAVQGSNLHLKALAFIGAKALHHHKTHENGE